MVSADNTVLVIGATGRVGRLVVDELLRAGVPVRASSRRPEDAALPIPESRDAPLRGAAAVFLVWTAAIASAPAVVARLAAHSGRRRVVYLSAPHQTPHPFFQQPNPLRDLHVEVERLLAAAPLNVVIPRPGMFASNALH